MLVVGAGDIGRAIGRMLTGFDAEITYVARTAREGVRATADLPAISRASGGRVPVPGPSDQ